MLFIRWINGIYVFIVVGLIQFWFCYIVMIIFDIECLILIYVNEN